MPILLNKSVISLIALIILISLSTVTQAIDVKYQSMRFFNSGAVAPKLPYRNYQQVFDKSTTKYVNIEFMVKNLWTKGTHRFFAQAKIYSPNGKLITSPKLKFIMPPGSLTRYYFLQTGYSTPGLWAPGKYKVKLYFDQQLVDTHYFKISTYSKPQGFGSTGSAKHYHPGEEYRKTYNLFSEWQVSNRTPYMLYISYHGKYGTQSTSIKPYTTNNIRLNGGMYHIHVSSSKSSIGSFIIKKHFRNGYKYKNRFYINSFPDKPLVQPRQNPGQTGFAI